MPSKKKPVNTASQLIKEEHIETGAYDCPFLSEVASRPIVIQNVDPVVDDGRYPAKKAIGESMTVWADIFKDGHDVLEAEVLFRKKGDADWSRVQMTEVNHGLCRWRGEISFHENALYEYTIESRYDAFATWAHGTLKKRDAKQDIRLELIEGRLLVEQTLERIRKKDAHGDDAHRLGEALRQVEVADSDWGRGNVLLSDWVEEIIARWPDPDYTVRHDRVYDVWVDREVAVFAAWYEIAPRSQGTEHGKSATFHDCIRRLPDIRAMGFDVVYLLPHHPIGRKHRKGPNNTLNAGPNDPGSPYAIGSDEGGHKDVHPDLGTLDDFKSFVGAARDQGMDVAIDFAIQCAPDHPWIKNNPDWFIHRPDGTIKYAENPPKKYEDIVNVNFWGDHAPALWQELLDTVLFWAHLGVRLFRVDNPHTKPIPFWEWLIKRVRAIYPDAIFLAEAFTRPPVMRMLAKVGFSQSYTYFTWRNDREGITEYVSELTQRLPKEHQAEQTTADPVDYMRPNFFPCTPDILPKFLQQPGTSPFIIRAALAATLSGVYGVYNGFELCENAAVPGKEEYLNSEKYEYKVWDWDRPGHIKPFIGKLNWIRRDNPAFHAMDTLYFGDSTNENVLFYGKMTKDLSNMVFIAISLDPYHDQDAHVRYPLEKMGLPPNGRFKVEDLLGGGTFEAAGEWQHVHLYPNGMQLTIYRVTALT